MDSNSFEIPISNFRRLIEHDFSDKFQFSFKSSSHEKSSLEISRNTARLISKKINDIFMIDPTIDEYEFSIPKACPKLELKDIENLVQLLIHSTQERVIIPKEKQNEFSMIRFLLGEDLPLDQVYNIANIEQAISLLNTDLDCIAIKYLSSHLIELIESGKMKNLNNQIVFSIIDQYAENESDKSDKKEEKEKIFSLMKKQEEESEIVIHFILSIKYEYCNEQLDEMLEFIRDHLDDSIVKNELSLFTAFIIRFLSNEKHRKQEKVESEKHNITECKFNGKEQSGIISHLMRKLGNGDEFKEALKLTGGGFPSPSYPITNLIKYGDTSTYYYNAYSDNPKSESDSWIEFDFVQNKIKLTSYTIQTYGDGPNSRYKPKTWRIVGSNDHEKWTVLNRQVNSPDLNDRYKQHRFECDKTDKFYRYIRYIQEDSWNSSDCKYSFSLACFELFGSILKPDI